MVPNGSGKQGGRVAPVEHAVEVGRLGAAGAHQPMALDALLELEDNDATRGIHRDNSGVRQLACEAACGK